MKNLEIGLEEVLNILTHWNVKHRWQVKDERGQLDGCCDPNDRTIYLRDNNPEAERKYTLLHELLHAHDINTGHSSPERPMKRRTDKLYEQIYGHKYLR